jgi:hypothetical protein
MVVSTQVAAAAVVAAVVVAAEAVAAVAAAKVPAAGHRVQLGVAVGQDPAAPAVGSGSIAAEE